VENPAAVADTSDALQQPKNGRQQRQPMKVSSMTIFRSDTPIGPSF
jgi:hypothetical protein